jgi:hypothetical protein
MDAQPRFTGPRSPYQPAVSIIDSTDCFMVVRERSAAVRCFARLVLGASDQHAHEVRGDPQIIDDHRARPLRCLP